VRILGASAFKNYFTKLAQKKTIAHRHFAMEEHRAHFCFNKFLKIVTYNMNFADSESKVHWRKSLWKESWFIHLYVMVVSPDKSEPGTFRIHVNLNGGKIIVHDQICRCGFPEYVKNTLADFNSLHPNTQIHYRERNTTQIKLLRLNDYKFTQHRYSTYLENPYLQL
jgi:hypothetical protein